MSLKIDNIPPSSVSTPLTLTPPKKAATPSAKSFSTSIADLFQTKTPKDVLSALHGKGFKLIDECHCYPQLSRQKDNPDIREMVETELPEIIAEKHPEKEQPLTICSLASGQGFEELVLLSKLQSKGYKKISLILVDPLYNKGIGHYFSKEQGQTAFKQIKYVAECISPGVQIHTLDSVEEVPGSTLCAETDVFLDFDDGLLGKQTLEDYQLLLQPLEKYIHSSSKPVIYLHSEKTSSEHYFDKQTGSLLRDVELFVTVNYISSEKDRSEERLHVKTTIPIPVHGTPNFQTFIHFIQSDEFESVKYCIEKGSEK